GSMTLPNWITFSRLLLAIPFLFLLEPPGHYFWALIFFLVASLTDWVDGFLARALNQVSTLGKLMDPLVDKVLVTGALVGLAAHGVLPAWSVTLILFREFLVTGLRALEASRGVIVPAGWLGKAKTVMQMVAIALLLFALSSGNGLASAAGQACYWLAVVLTLLSGAQYLWAARSLFREP
ncbi:MAG TPA: CDP-diacylglycerol--glycerol-3-phosphate 3-phosphatidyltransferase, partial [Oscillatoriaceae cyanobacterium]